MSRFGSASGSDQVRWRGPSHILLVQAVQVHADFSYDEGYSGSRGEIVAE